MAEFLKNWSSYLFMNFLFRGLIQVTIINGKLLVESRVYLLIKQKEWYYTVLLKNIEVHIF